MAVASGGAGVVQWFRIFVDDHVSQPVSGKSSSNRDDVSGRNGLHTGDLHPVDSADHLRRIHAAQWGADLIENLSLGQGNGEAEFATIGLKVLCSDPVVIARDVQGPIVLSADVQACLDPSAHVVGGKSGRWEQAFLVDREIPNSSDTNRWPDKGPVLKFPLF